AAVSALSRCWMSSFTEVVASAPQVRQWIRQNIRPFTSSTSNLNFDPHPQRILISIEALWLWHITLKRGGKAGGKDIRYAIYDLRYTIYARSQVLDCACGRPFDVNLL